jgi:hypothetical protein
MPGQALVALLSKSPRQSPSAARKRRAGAVAPPGPGRAHIAVFSLRKLAMAVPGIGALNRREFRCSGSRGVLAAQRRRRELPTLIRRNIDRIDMCRSAREGISQIVLPNSSASIKHLALWKKPGLGFYGIRDPKRAACPGIHAPGSECGGRISLTRARMPEEKPAMTTDGRDPVADQPAEAAALRVRATIVLPGTGTTTPIHEEQ